MPEKVETYLLTMDSSFPFEMHFVDDDSVVAFVLVFVFLLLLFVLEAEPELEEVCF